MAAVSLSSMMRDEVANHRILTSLPMREILFDQVMDPAQPRRPPVRRQLRPKTQPWLRTLSRTRPCWRASHATCCPSCWRYGRQPRHRAVAVPHFVRLCGVSKSTGRYAGDGKLPRMHVHTARLPSCQKPFVFTVSSCWRADSVLRCNSLKQMLNRKAGFPVLLS